MATDFHSDFLETIITVRGRPIFLKNLVFASVEETVFLNIFQTLTQMEVAFLSSEIAFFKEPFMLNRGNGFSINYKICSFIRSFFWSWWTHCLKLGVNQFSSIISIPNSGNSFPG